MINILTFGSDSDHDDLRHKKRNEEEENDDVFGELRITAAAIKDLSKEEVREDELTRWC